VERPDRQHLGSGSGVVVKDRVVLTAAHVVWDEARGQVAQNLRWFSTLHGPIRAEAAHAAWHTLITNYIIVRSNYLALGGTNAFSTPASRARDIALLYFDQSSSRGGYGGYLLSETESSIWLTGVTIRCSSAIPTGPGVQRGKFTKLCKITSLSKVSAGSVCHARCPGLPRQQRRPVYVQHLNTVYYPAAVYLGSSENRSYVRAIDSNIVRLINLAAALAVSEEATNELDPFFLNIRLTTNSSGTQLRKLFVAISPPAATANGARWGLLRVASNTFCSPTWFRAPLP